MKIINVIKKSAAAVLFLAAISLAGCDKDNPRNEKDPEKEPVKVTKVILSETALTLFIGQTDTLDVTIVPDSATNKTVEWASSNEATATVSNADVVTAVAEGKATITATTKDGGLKAGCTVTVQPKNDTTMTTAMKGEAGISLADEGTTVIDWGDESVLETFTLPATPAHTFSGTTPRTIVIEGQNIIYLNCNRQGLTALDVSQYPFPQNTKMSIIC